ncbi:hypothetical protein PGT21_025201 [Puccinia graminis f. sp. tritici]|uniref:Uncharacterized protein n=1 Tax=Puccinia graminis f. sp. tritici TaxID=56615 RepID=A0A5B0QPM1_PUCGR|nr:hypothetical protein PGT21_025201 [Puccinia graminis f. sp. tritici]
MRLPVCSTPVSERPLVSEVQQFDRRRISGFFCRCPVSTLPCQSTHRTSPSNNLSDWLYQTSCAVHHHLRAPAADLAGPSQTDHLSDPALSDKVINELAVWFPGLR